MKNGGCYVNAKRRSIRKESFIENWNFYINYKKMFVCGEHELPPFDVNGECGKYSFLCLENGVKVPTKELELVRKALEGKMSVNLQIKLWAEDVGILLMPTELKSYCVGMPEWIFKATIEQAKSRVLKKVGFIPTWLKM